MRRPEGIAFKQGITGHQHRLQQEESIFHFLQEVTLSYYFQWRKKDFLLAGNSSANESAPQLGQWKAIYTISSQFLPTDF